MGNINVNHREKRNPDLLSCAKSAKLRNSNTNIDTIKISTRVVWLIALCKGFGKVRAGELNRLSGHCPLPWRDILWGKHLVLNKY